MTKALIGSVVVPFRGARRSCEAKGLGWKRPVNRKLQACCRELDCGQMPGELKNPLKLREQRVLARSGSADEWAEDS